MRANLMFLIDNHQPIAPSATCHSKRILRSPPESLARDEFSFTPAGHEGGFFYSVSIRLTAGSWIRKGNETRFLRFRQGKFGCIKSMRALLNPRRSPHTRWGFFRWLHACFLGLERIVWRPKGRRFADRVKGSPFSTV